MNCITLSSAVQSKLKSALSSNKHDNLIVDTNITELQTKLINDIIPFPNEISHMISQYANSILVEVYRDESWLQKMKYAVIITSNYELRINWTAYNFTYRKQITLIRTNTLALDNVATDTPIQLIANDLMSVYAKNEYGRNLYFDSFDRIVEYKDGVFSSFYDYSKGYNFGIPVTKYILTNKIAFEEMISIAKIVFDMMRL